MPVYLDFNASTPVDETVLQFMNKVYKEHYGNADSRTHSFGSDAKNILEKSRKTIADILLTDETNIFFTSGATESNNISILGLIDYAKQTGKTHFITSAIEHKSVLEPIKHLETLGFQVDYIQPELDGRIDPNKILDRITPKTALVSIMHVNSETGIIQPVIELGEAIHETGVFFHVDATQSFGKLNQQLRNLKYDLLSFSSHKLRGPQGIGGLVIQRRKYDRIPIKPIFYGGSQERGYRPGTTPVALAAGFSLAAELCDKNIARNAERCSEIKQNFLKAVQGLEYRINGNQTFCLPSVINISFIDVDAEGMFASLKNSYAFSNGSACTSGSYAPSYVLKAMGLEPRDIAWAVRLSWDYDTIVDFSELTDYIRGQQSIV